MAGTDEKDIQQLKNRLIELADKAYSRNIYTYTPFLGLAEQQAYYGVEREVSYAGVSMEGGAPLCERKIIRFGDPGYEEAFPIVRLEIRPKTPKFAENLTHRDFLGAVMNLGIERDVVGDIFLPDEKGALLFCHGQGKAYQCGLQTGGGRDRTGECGTGTDFCDGGVPESRRRDLQGLQSFQRGEQGTV